MALQQGSTKLTTTKGTENFPGRDGSRDGLTLTSTGDIPVDGEYEFVISQELSDPEWDKFLDATSGVYFAQSSYWAGAKASQGWHVRRIVVREHGNIVGGVQLLMRPISRFGYIGYVSRGPVLKNDKPTLANRIIDKLLQEVRRSGIRVLIMQPNQTNEGLAELLQTCGFRRTSRSVSPPYTLLLDLESEVEDILANMKSRTRYNIRLSKRKDILVREGTEADLPAFHRIASLTSERQGFGVASEEFYRLLWQSFSQMRHVKLFLAEYQGEVVSAQLAIPFGDTVVNKLTVWSGQHSKLKPNEGLVWGAIEWAKASGYRYYDFGGLSPKGAGHYLDGEPFPEELKGTVTSFKLGFGGDVTVYPETYMFMANSIVRWLDQKFLVEFEDSKQVKQIVNRLRTS